MKLLTQPQLERLTYYIRVGASDASAAMSAWLGRSVDVSVEQLELVSLETAANQLGPENETVCICCMRVSGRVSGQLLFGFDDKSGLMLCDALLTRKSSSESWGEIEISAAMETTNIVGCAFLNSLSQIFPTSDFDDQDEESKIDRTWIPSPPTFGRDFAAAIMQFALIDQACEFDAILIAQTNFFIEKEPIGWRLLFIPDAHVLHLLARTLS
jgi:chemotaxis protein CheC